MPEQLPVNFESKVKAAGNSKSGGYPYQISSSDLMRNFVFATLEIDPKYVEQSTGMNGYPTRKLKMFSLPELPTSGTYVLGAVSGSIQWLSTEEC